MHAFKKLFMKIDNDVDRTLLRQEMMKVEVMPNPNDKRMLVIGRSPNKWALIKNFAGRAYRVYNSKQGAVKAAKRFMDLGQTNQIVVMDKYARVSKIYNNAL